MIVTGGFEFYGAVIRRVFGPAVLYAQVIKTRRHDRVVRVDRRAVIGAAWRFDEALTHSEDSSTVNTSFIERLNLTIRQSSAYLSRRTLFHASVAGRARRYADACRIVRLRRSTNEVAHRDILPLVTYDTSQYANNRVEASHQPTRQRERQMRGFTSSDHAQRFLHVHGVIQNLFRLDRHRLRSVHHRLLRARSSSSPGSRKVPSAKTMA